MAAEGLDYLPHLLAHIAYSRSQQFLADGQQRPGAYVKLAVQERALGDPNFMPPAGLSFEHALAWALRGGHFETDMPDDQAPEPEPEIDPALAEPIQTNAGQQVPLAVWQAALSRLQLELNKSVFDTWVRPAVLLGYESDPETFRLGVPHIYAKEWLERRLMHQIKSALGDIVGRQTEVTVKVKPAVDSTSRRKPP